MVSYKITPKVLKALSKKDLNSQAMAQAEGLEERFFQTQDDFKKALEKTDNPDLIKHQDWLVRKSRGYFRLDPWIEHRVAREWAEALLFALVVALVVRTFLFAPFKIPTGSMIPTIKVGDHIFASMFSYGVPLPGTDVKFFAQPVERGDIVIFPFPGDLSMDYIKRAIALEGETVQIIDDQVIINGKPLDEPYAFFDAQSIHQHDPLVSNYGPEVVPEGHVFVMGDNRYNSADSRFWGYVPVNQIKGKGQIIYWSKVPNESLFTGWFTWEDYQPGRIFMWLE